MRRGAVTTAVCIAVLIVLPIAEAAAEAPSVELDPAALIVDSGETFELSFRVSSFGDTLSGYQLYLSFDPDVVDLVSAREGSLYTESGCMTWFSSEELEPGRHYFFDTIFGEGTYIESPGELLNLTFRGADLGQTQAHVDTIRLADIDRCSIEVGTVGHGDVFVVESTGAGEDDILPRLGSPHPNPFRESIAIPCSRASGESGASIEIFDASGRLVRRLPVRGGNVTWDGLDERGAEAASSVYFLRLSGAPGDASARVVKLR